MKDMARVLSLSGMTVLDSPDSGLKEMDPRPLEDAEGTRQEQGRISQRAATSPPLRRQPRVAFLCGAARLHTARFHPGRE